MSFQIQILTSAQAPAFTAPVLREARKVFKEIRMALLMPAPDQYPFRVPQFDTLEELVFFLAMLGDDDTLRKQVDVFEFIEGGMPFIGLGLHKDRSMWLSDEGKMHLNASSIKASSSLTYVKRQLKAYLLS